MRPSVDGCILQNYLIPFRILAHSMSNTPMSFFQKTLADIGITEESNTIQITNFTNAQDPTDKVETVHHFFTEDKETGDVFIHYYTLQGRKYTYRKEGNKWPTDFVRIRKKVPFLNKDTGQEVKYISPSGAGSNPFFYKTIIDAYTQKQKIPTLVVTEGEKKAVAGCLAGIPTVGIPSIHGFYSGDIKGKIHDDLIDLIMVCQVEKIIFLTDADTLVIKYEKDKDLSKRQESFYSAVKYFREGLQFLLDEKKDSLNVYFAHIKTVYKEDGKGLDDLLVKFKDRRDEVIHDLNQFQFSTKFFSSKIITDGKMDKVREYFGLRNEQTFFAQYKEYIGNLEFLYKGRRYEWDGENVKYVRHEDTDKYLRVGADWMKLIKVPNKHGDLEEELLPYKITEITRDYKKYPDFIDNIPRFDSFCNVPSWVEDYKRVVNNCYNLCNPLMHIPKEGAFPTTTAFLKHVFQGKGNIVNGEESCFTGDQFTVILDWLTIIYQHPKQMVPVPILVSKENKTGKSTFLKWLQAIFGSNMAILGNDQFKMKFNAHYITKFIISIDEGFLDVDKKAEKERLKQLATADTAYLENKGMNIQKFPYYGKLIICSNDADNVMKMEDEETRWFVVKVPRISDEDEDPFLEEKMKTEIPAFLHFIRNRKIFHPRVSRLWFKTEWFITEQFKVIVENTRSVLEKEISEFIREMFFTYKVLEMGLPLEWLINKMNNQLKYRVNKTDIKKYLNEKKKMVAENRRSFIPIGFKETMQNTEEVEWDRKTAYGRPYIFKIADWLSPVEQGGIATSNSANDEPEATPF